MKQNKIAKYHLHKAHPEKLQFELYDLKEYRARSGAMAAKAHSHSYYQIIWFFNAGGTHSIDFNTYPIVKNTMLFISKDQIHAFDDTLDIEGWLIHFNEGFFMHTDVAIFLKHNVFKNTVNPCYSIDFKTAIGVSNYIGLIQEELKNRERFGYEETIRFLLKAMLIAMERMHQRDNSKQVKLTSQYELQLFTFKELLETNYMNGFSVSKYASLLHVSPKTLTNITKAMVGKSPGKLIAERIILEAKRLLTFTSLQIAEIAFKLGFDDVSYFVRYFKRNVGISPGKYRE